MNIRKLDLQLITDFRNKANENWTLMHIFQNHNGKNGWNKICSAMDWITVGAEGVDVSLLSSDNSNDASRRMMLFLSCIDVMWEGISQLHKVLYETDKIPLEDEHVVFKQKKNDNKFFKKIRAIFMAHPVNLQDVYGKSDQWYASWSGGQFSKEDFYVYLYSDIPGKDPVRFSVSFSDLMEFANRRYMLLTDFITKIDEIVEEYNQKWREIIIPVSEDPVEYISILMTENKNRWTNDWIRNRLDYLFDAFTVSPSEEKNIKILEEYQSALRKEIDEIHQMLQSVDYGHDLNETPVNIPHNMMYMYDQLYDGIPAIENIGVKAFRSIVSDIVDIDDSALDMEGVRVLIDAAMWKKSLR